MIFAYFVSFLFFVFLFFVCVCIGAFFFGSHSLLD